MQGHIRASCPGSRRIKRF